MDRIPRLTEITPLDFGNLNRATRTLVEQIE